jgi:protein NrfD
MEPTIVFNAQPGPYWDWKVAFDLFFGGAGVGAFLFAVALRCAFKDRYARIYSTAAWLAPCLVVLGLLFLFAKLGRPSELLLTFTHFAPTAPLWWGGIFQTLFVAGSAWYALQSGRLTADNAHKDWLGWLLAPIAVIVGVYHGALLAVVVARPLWNTGPTIVAAILGFGTTGIAAVMITHLVRMKIAGRLVENGHLHEFLDDMRPVLNLLVVLLALQLATFSLWWFSLEFGTRGDMQALAAANAAHGYVFWFVGIGLGLIVPLALGGAAVWYGEERRRMVQVRLIGLTSALILIGGVFFRLAVVLGGQVGPPFPTLS